MSELSRDARDLIAQAKKDGPSLLGPSAQDRARVREKLTPLWAAPVIRAKHSWSLRVLATFLAAGLGLVGWLAPHRQQLPPSAAALPEAPPPPAASSTDEQPAPSDLPVSRGAGNGDVRSQQETAPARPSALTSHATRQPCAAREQVAAQDPERRDARGDANHSASASQNLVAPRPCADAPTKTHRSAAASQPATPRPCPNTPATARADASRSAPVSQSPAPRLCSDTAASARAAASRSADAPASPRASAQEASVPRQRPPRTAAADSSTRPPLTAAAGNVRSDAHPAAPSIDGELELLSAAQSALQTQRPTRALTLLQEHAFRFPSGALSEERMAMQALALCASGRKHAAQAVLSNLEARGASSQLLPRVRSQCGL